MIDTIVFTLTKDQFQIIQPDKFQPSATLLLSTYSTIQAKQNPIRHELLKGNYKPRLTLQKRINSEGHLDLILKVELSLPKLLKDFPEVVQKLCAVLQEMGIATTEAMLAQASVSSIH